jgi:hypothetical protein
MAQLTMNEAIGKLIRENGRLERELSKARS